MSKLLKQIHRRIFSFYFSNSINSGNIYMKHYGDVFWVVYFILAILYNTIFENVAYIKKMV